MTVMVSANSRLSQVEDFVSRCHILTLATAGGGKVWSAPVYYVYFDRAFFFFSKADSRHILESNLQKSVAASIHADSQGWRDIKGVQMEGVINKAGLDAASLKAFQLYLDRFNFIDQIRPSGREKNVSLQMIETSFKAKFYKFNPTFFCYMDNTIHFGHRETIVL